MTFTAAIALRWSDLDAQGHVNNALIVEYLQEARVAFLRSGAASPLLDSGVVVVGHQVEYNSAIAYSDDPIQVELGVSSLGGARLELAYWVRQGDRLAATARTVLTPFDFAEQRPVRIPAKAREFFEQHRIETDPLRPIEAPSLHGRGTQVPLPIRWADLDSYGHVNNALVFDYLQQARITATTSWDPSMARAGAKGSERMWLVARQDVDYLVQLPHRLEPFIVHVAPCKLGRTSVTLVAEIVDPVDGTVHVAARTILVSADPDGRPLELGERTRERLQEHLVAN